MFQPDPNSNLWIRLTSAGPTLREPDQSVDCWTSTTGFSKIYSRKCRKMIPARDPKQYFNCTCSVLFLRLELHDMNVETILDQVGIHCMAWHASAFSFALHHAACQHGCDFSSLSWQIQIHAFCVHDICFISVSCDFLISSFPGEPIPANHDGKGSV